LAVAVIVRVVMTRTLFGYEVNAVGANPAAARFAGISTRAVLLKTALLSGGIAGLGGASELIGRAGYLTLDMATGYGFVGIVIAMLSQLDAVAVIFVSIAVAALMVGGDSMSRVVGVPTYMTDVVVSVALLSVLPAALFARYRVRVSR
jgi:simple sugar transport system permease protein